jgi:hypothetical protein
MLGVLYGHACSSLWKLQAGPTIHLRLHHWRR